MRCVRCVHARVRVYIVVSVSGQNRIESSRDELGAELSPKLNRTKLGYKIACETRESAKYRVKEGKKLTKYASYLKYNFL